jgi:hypothetical protein
VFSTFAFYSTSILPMQYPRNFGDVTSSWARQLCYARLQWIASQSLPPRLSILPHQRKT